MRISWHQPEDVRIPAKWIILLRCSGVCTYHLCMLPGIPAHLRILPHLSTFPGLCTRYSLYCTPTFSTTFSTPFYLVFCGDQVPPHWGLLDAFIPQTEPHSPSLLTFKGHLASQGFTCACRVLYHFNTRTRSIA